MAHISMVRFEVTKAEQVEAQDIIDAVRTLKPLSKIVIQIPHPGHGPDHFLQWAREELVEAEATTVASQAARKAFNVSVLSKCAFECLVDWYLSKHLLHLTIRPFAGLSEKLEALNAEARLGIGLSLFQNTISGRVTSTCRRQGGLNQLFRQGSTCRPPPRFGLRSPVTIVTQVDVVLQFPK